MSGKIWLQQTALHWFVIIFYVDIVNMHHTCWLRGLEPGITNTDK